MQPQYSSVFKNSLNVNVLLLIVSYKYQCIAHTWCGRSLCANELESRLDACVVIDG